MIEVFLHRRRHVHQVVKVDRVTLQLGDRHDEARLWTCDTWHTENLKRHQLCINTRKRFNLTPNDSISRRIHRRPSLTRCEGDADVARGHLCAADGGVDLHFDLGVLYELRSTASSLQVHWQVTALVDPCPIQEALEVTQGHGGSTKQNQALLLRWYRHFYVAQPNVKHPFLPFHFTFTPALMLPHMITWPSKVKIWGFTALFVL